MTIDADKKNVVKRAKEVNENLIQTLTEISLFAAEIKAQIREEISRNRINVQPLTAKSLPPSPK